MVYFIFLIIHLFQQTLASYCGSYIPYNGDSCWQYTNSSSICCFLRGNFEGNYHTMCYPFSRDIYYKMSRSVKINGYAYQLDCGQARGTLCGEVVNPISYKDCSIYSTKTNSCCFYKYKYKDHRSGEYIEDTNCVWLGTSDIGEMSYNKLTVICNYRYLYIKAILLFLLIFLML